MLLAIRPILYSVIMRGYILLHTVGLGLCLDGHITKNYLRLEQHPNKYKKFACISNYLIEQANEVAPFLGSTLYKLQNSIAVDINQKDCYGKTALHYAAKLRNPLFVNILLEHGADLEAKDASYRTALQIAASVGNLSVVKQLLTVPTIQVNAQDHYAETALYLAVEGGYVPLVETLLNHPKTAVDLPNFLGKTAVAIAIEKKQENFPSLQERYALILSKLTEKKSPRKLDITF